MALPYAMIAWALLGMGLDIGLARFTYGVTLPAMRRDLGLDYTISGTLNTIHLAGYLIGTVAAPMLLRRMSPAWLGRAGHLLFAAGAAACAMAPGVPMLAVGRLVSGVGAAGGITAILVITLEAVSARQRPVVSAAVWSGLGVAVAASGLAAPALLDHAAGWRIGFAASAAVALALALGFPPRHRRRTAAAPLSLVGAPADRLTLRSLLARRWCFLMAAYAAFGVAYIAYVTFVGTRLAAAGASLAAVQAVWVLQGLGCVAGSVLAVLALRVPLGRRIALTAALASCCGGTFIASFAGLPAAMAGAILFGLGMASGPAMVTAYLRDRSTAASYPQALSFATVGLGLGQLVGPVAAGLLSDRFGAAAAAQFAAVVFAFAALAALVDEVQPVGRG